MPEDIPILSTGPHFQTRTLNLENVKNQAVESYEGVKTLVQTNLILSICIGCVVLLVFILCCYLRCKYKRNATIMSKRQHDRLMEQRSMRKVENERNRLENHGNKRERENTPLKDQEEANLVNNSFETRATILSDTDDAKFRDIENDGIELKFDGDVLEKRPVTQSANQQPADSKQGSRFKRFFGRSKQ